MMLKKLAKLKKYSPPQEPGLYTDQQLYTWLLGYLKPYKKRFACSFITSIPASALNGAIVLVSAPLLDRFIKHQDYMVLVYFPSLVMLISVLSGIFEYISNYYSNHVGYSISRDIRKELFSHLNRMDFSYYKAHTVGQVYTRFYSDTLRLQQAIVNNLQGLTVQIFSVLFLAISLLYQDWQLALLAMGIISLIWLPLHFISRKIRYLDNFLQDINAQICNIYHEHIYGIKEVLTFHLNNYQKHRFDKTLDQYFSALMRTTKTGILLRPLVQFISAIGISSVAIIGALKVQSGLMSPGQFGAFVLACIMLYRPIKTLGSTAGRMQRLMAPAERVAEILGIAPQLKEAENPVLVEDFKNIAFENVTFAYNENKTALKNINLTIQAGEVIALIGPSGGGKTTLVDLIPRLLDPTEGRVLLNGVDLRDISFKNLRRLMSVVSQETVLFNTTIRENILLGQPHATEDELKSAVEDANLTEWLDSLPEGLDYIVGERGRLISGGQRQRIAIARAFIRKAPVLILDEATSALDNQSEAMVQEALMRLMQDRTVIVIAHRLSTIKFADRIIVIGNGEVVETGNHDELMALRGIYHGLYRLQFREEDMTPFAASLPLALS